MSSDAGRQRPIRRLRVAEEVVIGTDGQIVAAGSSLVSDDPAEMAEAASLIDVAQERADEVVRDASMEAAAIEHQAYEAGRSQGYQDGQVEARAELAEALAQAQAVANQAKAVRDRLLWDSEREIIELVIAAARSVVGERVSIEPSLVMDTVERALTRAGSQNLVRIKVHPDQQQIVSVAMDERFGDARDFDVQADGSIEIGGCIINTVNGEIDARLDVQLAEVARVLRDAVPNARSAEGEGPNA